MNGSNGQQAAGALPQTPEVYGKDEACGLAGVRRFAVALAVLAGSAGMVQAACAPIAKPGPVATIEGMKEGLLAGDPMGALDGLGIPDDDRAELATALSAFLSKPAAGCVSVRRVRPSENFISEVFTIEVDDQHVFFSVSGFVRGGAFDMINISYTDDFNQVRELMY